MKFAKVKKNTHSAKNGCLRQIDNRKNSDKYIALFFLHLNRRKQFFLTASLTFLIILMARLAVYGQIKSLKKVIRLTKNAIYQ